MEDGLERPFHGAPIRVGVHQVLHVVPPAAHQRMLRQQLALVARLELEHGEQVHGFFVEEDRVVVDACAAQQRRQVGPDLVVAFLVFVHGAWLQFHPERQVHLPASLSTTTALGGISTRSVPAVTRAPLKALGCTLAGLSKVLMLSMSGAVSMRPDNFPGAAPTTLICTLTAERGSRFTRAKCSRPSPSRAADAL